MASTYVKDFSISLGPMVLTGKLCSVVKSSSDKESKSFNYACPECPSATPVKQRYYCEHNHGPFGTSDKDGYPIVKRMNADTAVTVTKEEADTLKKSGLPKDVLDLSIHPAGEISSHLLPSGKAYAFIPKTATKWTALMGELVENRDFAFVGLCNLRGHEKFVRLTKWNGQMVVEHMLYPEELNEFDQVEAAPVDPKLMAQAGMLLEGTVEPFDPTAYRNERKARVETFIVERAGAVVDGTDNVTALPVKPAADSTDAAIEALEAWMKTA